MLLEPSRVVEVAGRYFHEASVCCVFIYFMRHFVFFFFFSSRRRHTRCSRDWSSDVCSSDLFSPLKGSFYSKAGGQAIGNDPFESLIDPHASMGMKRNLTEGWFFGILPDMNTDRKSVV